MRADTIGNPGCQSSICYILLSNVQQSLVTFNGAVILLLSCFFTHVNIPLPYFLEIRQETVSLYRVLPLIFIEVSIRLSGSFRLSKEFKQPTIPKQLPIEVKNNEEIYHCQRDRDSEIASKLQSILEYDDARQLLCLTFDETNARTHSPMAKKRAESPRHKTGSWCLEKWDLFIVIPAFLEIRQ